VRYCCSHCSRIGMPCCCVVPRSLWPASGSIPLRVTCCSTQQKVAEATTNVQDVLTEAWLQQGVPFSLLELARADQAPWRRDALYIEYPRSWWFPSAVNLPSPPRLCVPGAW